MRKNSLGFVVKKEGVRPKTVGWRDHASSPSVDPPSVRKSSPQISVSAKNTVDAAPEKPKKEKTAHSKERIGRSQKKSGQTDQKNLLQRVRVVRQSSSKGSTDMNRSKNGLRKTAQQHLQSASTTKINHSSSHTPLGLDKIRNTTSARKSTMNSANSDRKKTIKNSPSALKKKIPKQTKRGDESNEQQQHTQSKTGIIEKDPPKLESILKSKKFDGESVSNEKIGLRGSDEENQEWLFSPRSGIEALPFEMFYETFSPNNITGLDLEDERIKNILLSPPNKTNAKKKTEEIKYDNVSKETVEKVNYFQLMSELNTCNNMKGSKLQLYMERYENKKKRMEEQGQFEKRKSSMSRH